MSGPPSFATPEAPRRVDAAPRRDPADANEASVISSTIRLCGTCGVKKERASFARARCSRGYPPKNCHTPDERPGVVDLGWAECPADLVLLYVSPEGSRTLLMSRMASVRPTILRFRTYEHLPKRPSGLYGGTWTYLDPSQCPSTVHPQRWLAGVRGWVSTARASTVRS